MLALSSVFLVLPVLSSICNAWSVTATGFTTVVNGTFYYSPPDIVATISLPANLVSSLGSSGYGAITVITTGDSAFSTSSLAATKANFSSSDDVWQEAFADTIYLQYTGIGELSSLSSFSSVITSDGTTSLPNGPYLVSAYGAVYKVYRLYSDFAGAFTESVIENSNGTFSVLPAGIWGQNLGIAVPSRLYFSKTPEQPLAGVRLGVKDIYDIAGLRTSCGNRAYYHLYPEANYTGPAVQSLIDAGAIIVGKMKTSQFANGEVATSDWVDYHSPFNPRGDGYQDPSSSSSGPGAGTGSYDWLDLTIGSDTGGSIRGPSEVQGLFGNRPSHGLVSLDNVMPLAPELDTAGFLTRDPFLWKTAAGVLYGSNITFTKSYPSEILTVDFPTTADTDGDKFLIDFVSTLSSFLKANVTAYNITADWADSNPAGTPPLTELLNITYPLLISQEQTRLVRTSFYADYAAQHDGRLPFVDPVPLYRWSFGDNSSQTIANATANMTYFGDWWNSHVLTKSKTSCSSKLLLYVGSNADVDYRNIYLDPPEVPYGFGISRVSGFSETPDFVWPIGQAEYASDITNHTEYLPVTVDIMAAKGCDGMLYSLAEDLVNEGILKAAVTGQSGIDGGSILFKRQLQ